MAIFQRDRVYSLIVGKDNDAVEINNLQIKFDVVKTSSNKDKKNTASIEIYNLSESRRKALEQEYVQVVFKVGYADTDLVTLFSGQVTNITTSKLTSFLTKRQGTSFVTTLDIDELYKEVNGITVSGLVPAGQTVRDVIQRTVKDIPEIARQEMAGVGITKTLPNGYPLAGTPRQILDKLSHDYDIEWQINEGVLYVSDYGGTYSEDRSSVFSFGQFSGLIERPEYINEEAKRIRRASKGKEPKKPVKENAVKFRVLLNPSIIAGSIVHLDFEPYTGYYKVDEVKHFGGFRDNDWYSELRCSAKVD